MLKVGDVIQIIEMKGETRYAGARGIVTSIDGIGQAHGTWGGCAIIPNEDSYRVIKKGDEKKWENNS